LFERPRNRTLIGFSNTSEIFQWGHGSWDGTFPVMRRDRAFKETMQINVSSNTSQKVMVFNATPSTKMDTITLFLLEPAYG